jgi:hypothetical protein
MMMSRFSMRSAFGNVHLGYVVIETEKLTDWIRFGRDAIGMHPSSHWVGTSMTTQPSRRSVTG